MNDSDTKHGERDSGPAPTTQKTQEDRGFYDFSKEKFNTPRLFLACSSDVEEVRHRLENEVNDLLASTGTGTAADRVTVYSWVTETKSDHGLDQRYAMQANIPLPNDKRCRAAICLFGERIGIPFSAACPASEVPNMEQWVERGLLHPWPEEPKEASLALEQGKFPLTGTVFEYLRSLDKTSGTGRPVWLGFLGKCPHSAEQWDEVVYNEGKWLQQCAPSSSASPKEIADFKDRYYDPQVRAIWNFTRALSKKANVDVRWYESHDALIDAAKTFVAEDVLSEMPTDNPYRAWSCLKAGDGALLHSRGGYVQDAVAALFEMWEADDSDDSEGSRVSAKIVGVSGVGKSSLMKAGVLEAMTRKNDHDYKTAELDPTTLLPDPSLPRKEVLAGLLDFILKDAGLDTPELDKDISKLPPQTTPKDAVNLLVKAIEHLDSGCRLVLGIDQFEEIVDACQDDKTKARWKPVFEFIDLAAKAYPIGVVFTLEASRQVLLRDNLSEYKVFDKAREVTITADRAFCKHVITQPFRDRGYHLSDSVVTAILDNLAESSPDQSTSDFGALLPLLAVMLHGVYEHVRLIRQPMRRGDNTSETDRSNASTRSYEITEGDLKGKMDLHEVTKRWAQLAWQRAENGPPPNPESLDYLLYPLVAVELDTDAATPDTDAGQKARLSLRSISIPTYYREQRLTEQWHRRRLMVRNGETVKLTHESIIRHWEPAAKWLELRFDDLKTRQLMRSRANVWHGEKNLDLPTPQYTLQFIDDAASVLNAHLRNWTLHDGEGVAAEDRLLMDYCLAVFSQAKAPREEVAVWYDPKMARNPYVAIAAVYGMTDLLEQFAQDDPDCLTDLFGRHQRPVLHYAAWCNLKSVTWLLEQPGASALTRCGQQFLPIDSAIIEDHDKIFDALLEAMLATGKDGHDLVVSAGEREDGWTLLHRCAEFNRQKMAKKLMDEGADPSAKEQDRESLPMHLVAGAQTSDNTTCALFKSLSWESNIKPSTPNKLGWNALHYAAAAGNLCIVNLLLQDDQFRDKHLNAKTKSGYSALHLAAMYKRPAVIKALRECMTAGEVNAPAGEEPLLAKEPKEPGEPECDIERIVAGYRSVLDLMTGDPEVLGKTEAEFLNLLAPDSITLEDRFVTRIVLVMAHQSSVGESQDSVDRATTVTQKIKELLEELADDQDAPEETARQFIYFVRYMNSGRKRRPIELALTQFGGIVDEESIQETVEALLDFDKLDLDARGPEPWVRSPADMAEQLPQVYSKLVKHAGLPVDTSSIGLSRLLQIGKRGMWHVLKTLLERLFSNAPQNPEAVAHAVISAQDPKTGDTLLHMLGRAKVGNSIRNNLLDFATAEHLAEINMQGHNPLHAALVAHRFSNAEQLLNHKNAVVVAPLQDRSPLELILENGSKDARYLSFVPKLLELSPDLIVTPNDMRWTPVHTFCAAQIEEKLDHTIESLCESLTQHPEVWTKQDISGRYPLDLLRPEARAEFRSQWGLDESTAPAPQDWPEPMDWDDGYDWRKLEEGTRDDWVKWLEEHEPDISIDSDTILEDAALPFYPNEVRLLRVRDRRWKPSQARLYALSYADVRQRLNGSSPPIHKLNAATDSNSRAFLKLDSQEKAAKYLRYFCFMVRGEEGPFLILERPDHLIKSDPSLESIAKRYARPSFYAGSRPGHNEFLFSSTVWYANALFRAVFSVQRTGMIEMIRDDITHELDKKYKPNFPLSPKKEVTESSE